MLALGALMFVLSVHEADSINCLILNISNYECTQKQSTVDWAFGSGP